MVCHGELARLKPSHGHLTSFYLMISVGGALGGVLVGLVAPHFFTGYFELPIGLVWCAAMIVLVLRPGSSGIGNAAGSPGRCGSARWRRRSRWPVIWDTRSAISASGSRLLVRNFYGALRVHDEGDGVDEAACAS